MTRRQWALKPEPSAKPILPGSPEERWLARKRRTSIISAVVLALSLAVFIVLALNPSGRTIQRVRAPDFRVADVRNAEAAVSLADAAGKPVVLNFLASWCEPCRDELPMFARVAASDNHGVRFIGIDTKDSETRGRELLDQTGVAFPVGADPDGAVAARYRVEGMPTTVFIGADGHIERSFNGPLDAATLARNLALIAAP